MESFTAAFNCLDLLNEIPPGFAAASVQMLRARQGDYCTSRFVSIGGVADQLFVCKVANFSQCAGNELCDRHVQETCQMYGRKVCGEQAIGAPANRVVRAPRASNSASVPCVVSLSLHEHGFSDM
jgi:hypothetical protein